MEEKEPVILVKGEKEFLSEIQTLKWLGPFQDSTEYAFFLPYSKEVVFPNINSLGSIVVDCFSARPGIILKIGVEIDLKCMSQYPYFIFKDKKNIPDKTLAKKYKSLEYFEDQLGRLATKIDYGEFDGI